MLGFLRSEAERGALDPVRLACWSATRSRQLAAAQFGIIVHQLDVLACFRPSVDVKSRSTED
jgi:hypothetical protein